MNILLYAPILTGHPQVYCRVIGDILIEKGHSVLIASGTDSESWTAQWQDLQVFRGNPQINLVDTRTLSDRGLSHLTGEEMVRVQKDFNVDSTLFIEADYFCKEFRRIAGRMAPRLRGQNVAIFANSCVWYPGEDPYSGRAFPFFDRSLRGNLGKIKRAVFNRKQSAKYFYEKILIDMKTVDTILVKDERLAEHVGPPVHWMPEIYRVFLSSNQEEWHSDWDLFSGPIRDYVRRAGRENILLYFGTGTWYKGYDYFLRLADVDPTTYALHAGAPNREERGKQMDFDTEKIRERLIAEGRLFETRAFIKSNDLIRLVFGSIERFVSTHRLTLSSGTMLQALELGIPVLTPDSGLIGYRTRANRLGITYSYLDDSQLASRWKEFRTMASSEFSEPIAVFMKKFSRNEVARVFTECLCG